jgi:CheY-like chemotaxis protein
MSEAATAPRAVESATFSPDAHSGGESKAKILLVDDEPKSLFALQELLASLDQTLMTAPSGEEALRLVLKHEFAVVLLDVRMPGIDGFETAKLIRGASARSRRRSSFSPPPPTR